MCDRQIVCGAHSVLVLIGWCIGIGTTGAYTAWPALATEALCYVEGNCSSAFSLMASFAPNTFQGAFGQANAVPQLEISPYMLQPDTCSENFRTTPKMTGVCHMCDNYLEFETVVSEPGSE